MKICGVIPAFNSESTIAHVVKETRRNIDHVVVIDDGSTDRTARLAEETGARVIRIKHNKGKGNALKIGFQYALANKFDAIITLDADLQHGRRHQRRHEQDAPLTRPGGKRGH